MSTEIQINEHAENDVEHLLYPATGGKEPRRNPAKRYAEASVAVTYAEADSAQLEVAIAAVRNANDAAYDHLVALLRGAREREHMVEEAAKAAARPAPEPF